MLAKCIFFDITNDGHHWFYNFSIMKKLSNYHELYYCSCDISEEQENELLALGIKVKTFSLDKRSTLKRNISLIKIMRKFKRYIINEKIDKVVFIYFDPMYLSFFPFIGLKKEIFITIHWIAKSKIKKELLKFYTNLTKMNIIVHEDVIKKEIINGGIKEDVINVVYYPISSDKPLEKNISRSKIGVHNSLPIILYFGGTRYDKGLDILLEALKNIKKEYNLVIAGKEETFKRDFIMSKLQEVDIKDENVIINLNYIAEDDVKYYFSGTDILVLPYRKMFMGQSGPLTEGLKHECVILAPDWFVLGDTINKYNCGVLYEAENTTDLSDKMEYCLSNYKELKGIYHQGCDEFMYERKLDKFIEKYVNIINNV